MTDTLLALAELAVAIAGFAAIVESLGRRGRRGLSREAVNEFNGMLFHALLALLAALLPVALGALEVPEPAHWAVPAGLLGLVMVPHAAVVAFRFLPAGRTLQRAIMLAVPLPMGVALLATALGWTSLPLAGSYVAAVCVQLAQAAFLFFDLSYLRAGERAPGPDSD